MKIRTPARKPRFNLRGAFGNWRGIVGRANRAITRRKAVFPSRLKTISRSIPEKPFHFPELERGYFCMRYARMAAKQLFGLDYSPAPAWRARNVNHVVWRAGQNEISLDSMLRPGQLVGILNPSSLLNRWWRPYTHIALVVGRKNDEPWIMHRVGSKDLLEPLSVALRREKWTLKEVLEPESLS